MTMNNNIKVFKSTKLKKDNKKLFYFNLEEGFDKNFILENNINLIIFCAYNFDYFTLKEGLKKTVEWYTKHHIREGKINHRIFLEHS